jgi:hypothetical protein
VDRIGRKGARTPRVTIGALTLCLVGLVGTPIGFAVGGSVPVEDVGAVPLMGTGGPAPAMGRGSELAQRGPSPHKAGIRPEHDMRSRGRALPSLGVHLATLEAQPGPVQRPVPSRVRLVRVGIDARVVPVEVLASGGMEVPEDVNTVGWYRFGPSPGRPGSAVLSGHVDSRVQGAGAFFRLQDVKPGDEIIVHFSDGSVRRFRAEARRSFPTSGLPEDLFVRAGQPVLALITCGGPFDSRTHHYAENVVVYAVPR